MCKERLLGKLVLTYEDEILNKTETSLDNKKITCEKNNFFCNISMVVLVYYYYLSCLLVVITITQDIG